MEKELTSTFVKLGALVSSWRNRISHKDAKPQRFTKEDKLRSHETMSMVIGNNTRNLKQHYVN